MHRFAPALVLMTSACTPDYGMRSYMDAPEAPSEPTTPAATGPTTAAETPPDEPPADDCDHTSDLIYTIDRTDHGLYLYDPATADFAFQFELDCVPFGSPGSMAVSRDGHAYVRYDTNEVYAVDLVTGDCVATRYGGGAFGAFGMGFATDDADTWRDRLYVANSATLAEVDTATWSATALGAMPSQSELTGNAEGELWAFLPLESPARLTRIDKATGASLERIDLAGFANPMDVDAFAFATWGGEFYLFVRTYGMGHTTNVYTVSADGALTPAALDTGMDIVGAGVSTCAPTE